MTAAKQNTISAGFSVHIVQSPFFTAVQISGLLRDIETGLYYCQSRYYDPVTGRFVNADELVSTGQEFLGYNMFAYCNNNPVKYL